MPPAPQRSTSLREHPKVAFLAYSERFAPPPVFPAKTIKLFQIPIVIYPCVAGFDGLKAVLSHQMRHDYRDGTSKKQQEVLDHAT